MHYSKLIAIFADELQVLLREGVRFNDSNLVKKERLTFILPQKRGKFLISKGNGNMLTFGIIVPIYGNDIPQYVGYCFIIS